MPIQPIIIGRGKAGWHASGICNGNRCSSSGGTLEGYAKDAKTGTPVYDADKADTDAFTSLVISGPMVDPTLEPGTVKRFGEDEKRAMLGMLPGLGGAFATLATLAMADVSSLDYVATDVYLAMLRERVPGVRFGRVERGSVVWEGS